MLKKILSVILCLSFVVTLFPVALVGHAEEEIVKDGLVAWYDGKNNTENGHDANSLTWYDLVGDNDIKVSKNSTNYFTDNAYHVKSAQYKFPTALLDLVNSSEFTVELTLGELKKIGSTYATLINNDGNDNFSLFWRVSGDFIEFKAGSNTRPKVTGGLDYFNDSTVAITFKHGSKICMYVDGILIHETAASSKIGATGNFFFGHSESTKAHEADYESMRFYNRALTAAEVANNAKADGNFDENYVPDPEFVDVAQAKTNIVGDICLSTYITSSKDLEALKTAEVKPANAIFYVNKNLKATDKAYSNEFATVEEILTALDYKIIPTFYVANNEAAKAVVDYLKSIKIIDAYIMSSDPAVVKYAREEYTSIRGIIDYTEKYKDKTVTQAELIEIRKTNTVNLAKVAVIPDTAASQDNVKYLNSRQITTWIGATSSVTTDKHAVEMLVSGTYGIISDNTAFVYETAGKYLGTNSLTRTPLIIGHRGIPGTMPENTLEGAIEAYKQGADVIEVDIYITLDGVIVVNHDSTTSKYDKKISVESTTLAKLKELNYTHNGVQYKMPTLEEYFKEFKGKDCMIFIEIKSSKPKLITAMKELIEEYDIYDQCAVIAFEGTNQLNNLRTTYPEMPVGFLVSSTYTGDSMLPSIQKTIMKYNTTYNPSYSGYDSAYVRDAVMRGITTWPWTINGATNINKYIMYGHSGITTDNSDMAGNLTEKLTLEYTSSENGYKVGDVVELSVVKNTYNHKTLPGKNIKYVIIEGGDVASISGNKLTFNKEGSVTVMATQNDLVGSAPCTVYTQPITFNVTTAQVTDTTVDTESNVTDTEVLSTPTPTDPAETENNTDGGNNVVIIVCCVVAAVLVIGGVCVVIIIKKRK